MDNGQSTKSSSPHPAAPLDVVRIDSVQKSVGPSFPWATGQTVNVETASTTTTPTLAFRKLNGPMPSVVNPASHGMVTGSARARSPHAAPHKGGEHGYPFTPAFVQRRGEQQATSMMNGEELEVFTAWRAGIYKPPLPANWPRKPHGKALSRRRPHGGDNGNESNEAGHGDYKWRVCARDLQTMYGRADITAVDARRWKREIADDGMLALLRGVRAVRKACERVAGGLGKRRQHWLRARRALRSGGVVKRRGGRTMTDDGSLKLKAFVQSDMAGFLGGLSLGESAASNVVTRSDDLVG